LTIQKPSKIKKRFKGVALYLIDFVEGIVENKFKKLFGK
jgi:hypothetical protein